MTDKIDDKYGFDRDSQCCSDWRDCSVYNQLQQSNKRIEELENQVKEEIDVTTCNSMAYEQKLKQIEEKIREYKDDCDDYEGDNSNGYCYGCQGVYCLVKQLTKIIKDGE